MSIWHIFLSGSIFAGIAFVFSLIKPTKFTKKVLPSLIFLLFILLLIRIGRVFLVNYLNGWWVFMLIVFAFPPLATLLMSLSGASSLADRCSPRLGIPLTILNAAGCTGLYVGLLLAYFYKIIVEGHGLGANQGLYIKIIGGIETVVVLIYAFIIWKQRLIEDRKTMALEPFSEFLKETRPE